MPEPQGDAPVVSNHGNTNFTKAGVNSGVAPSKFDQTDNSSAVKSSSQSSSMLNKHSTHKM